MALANQYYGGQYIYPPQQYRYDPQIAVQPQPSFSLKGRPVGSIDEARASMIDFDGTTFYFPDLAKRCIYTKRINLDGTSSLETYQLVETPPPVAAEALTINTSNFVTNDVFNKTVSDLMEQINSLKGVVTPNEQPNTNTTNEQFTF